MTAYEFVSEQLSWFHRDEKGFMQYIVTNIPVQFVYRWRIIPELKEKKGLPSVQNMLIKYDEDSLRQYIRSYTSNLPVENRVMDILLCLTFIQEIKEKENKRSQNK